MSASANKLSRRRSQRISKLEERISSIYTNDEHPVLTSPLGENSFHPVRFSPRLQSQRSTNEGLGFVASHHSRVRRARSPGSTGSTSTNYSNLENEGGEYSNTYGGTPVKGEDNHKTCEFSLQFINLLLCVLRIR